MMMNAKTFWALPGFLGLPQDWDCLSASLGKIRAVDLYHIDFSCKKLKEWGKGFNAWIAAQQMDPGILMGYSLGGRLALHALIDDPFQWKAAVIISAHPGLQNPDDRIERLKRDASWAYRFGTEEWSSLMDEWNNQEAFVSSSFQFDRKESDYERQQLVDMMMMASLGQQEDLSQSIAELSMPILWITGVRDSRYKEMARQLTFSHPDSRWVEIEGAGHRVPWEAPQEFARVVNEFLRQIETA
jgi:2-succinyl-6-hydroxy-2,4-cyclohexadiene-1-carboxylate synthase